MSNELTKPISRTDKPDFLSVGSWYWDGDELICVTSIGSNYAAYKTLFGFIGRIHFDNVLSRLRPAPDWREKVDQWTQESKNLLNEKMSDIIKITSEIGLSSQASISGSGLDSMSAMVKHGSFDKGSHIERLENIQNVILPQLFMDIKKINERLAHLMGADLIPVNAEIEKFNGYKGHIQNRIFNVEIYAGLEEKIIHIRSGQPAPVDTPLDVMQRLLYMDEEALLRWDDGGLDFDSLEEFDLWLAEDSNLDRILPFQRCVVAFQIRRHNKDRSNLLSGISNFRDYYATIRSIERMSARDKYTYLYIRNGENLYRLIAPIEFTEKLFPDPENSIFGQQLMAPNDSLVRLSRCITVNEYEQRVEEYESKLEEYNRNMAEDPDGWHRPPRDPRKEFVPLDHSNVYLDDVEDEILSKLTKSNRIALILQGLFDRSNVLHPHPPVKLWRPESFNKHIRLRVDSDRALYPFEDAPDIDDYINSLNSKIEVGSVCLGAYNYWISQLSEHVSRPWNDDGPSPLSRVVAVRGKGSSKSAKFVWKRKILSGRNQGRLLERHIWVPFECLFNVSEYKPGDFKRFFFDPRTRENYLKWAPVMFVAEDFHSGKLVADPPRDYHPIYL